MNAYVIAGIVLIALGTLVMTFGSNKSSAESQKEILDKFEETQQKIEKAKGSTDSDKGKEEIEQIENEFNEWASEFINNRERRKLELEKKDLDIKGNRVALSAKWKPQFETFFSSIRKIIDVYNKQAGTTITYDIVKLPENIFDPSVEDYEAKIKFRSDVIWLINVAPASALADKHMPNIKISILDKESIAFENNSSILNTKDAFSIIVKDDSTSKQNPIILIVKYKNDRYNMKNIPEDYEVKDGVFKELAKDLVGNQLLQL
ncbi:hypothetical protein GCM10023188_25350 [Pontibacter saemangeumensis]|uniref:Uncharacterized protein n=2 Tax=Pontibacter saemangeumensis TaxID=1084525 RepID=A0ABP8LQV3_9BACT